MQQMDIYIIIIFSLFPTLWSPLVGEKKHTDVYAKLSQDQNSSLQKPSCTQLI